jgi:hypothetical protein
VDKDVDVLAGGEGTAEDGTRGRGVAAAVAIYEEEG